jgi:hypothetical protein
MLIVAAGGNIHPPAAIGFFHRNIQYVATFTGR